MDLLDPHLQITPKINKNEGVICNKIVKILANQILTDLPNNSALKQVQYLLNLFHIICG